MGDGSSADQTGLLDAGLWLERSASGIGCQLLADSQVRTNFQEPNSNFRIWILVLGSWFLVLGSWFLVLGSWFLVLGSWFLVLGSWFLVLGSWFLVLGSWFLVLGS